MRHYLSFGGGVNSVALYLLMQELGMEFEALFVNHGGDWPETYEYVDYFVATGRPITVLHPDVGTIEGDRFDNIVDYYRHRKLVPSRRQRACTDRFKVVTLNRYQKTPCTVHIGYAADEAHRAKIHSDKGRDFRWLLIEHDISRRGCIDMIKKSGLKVPRKSGCFMCPYQGRREYIELRRTHPDLFCIARTLEETQNSRITADGKPWKPYYLCGKPLGDVVTLEDERQLTLPGKEEQIYPPCECGL